MTETPSPAEHGCTAAVEQLRRDMQGQLDNLRHQFELLQNDQAMVGGRVDGFDSTLSCFRREQREEMDRLGADLRGEMKKLGERFDDAETKIQQATVEELTKITGLLTQALPAKQQVKRSFLHLLVYGVGAAVLGWFIKSKG